LRRWRTAANRRIGVGDIEAHVQDLVGYLIAIREREPRLVGPLKVDYEYLARCVAKRLA
jgi:hypothetical protein